MLTRFIKFQLVLFTILTILAMTVLGWYYLRVPSADAETDPTAEAVRDGERTYRGTQIGKVTAVERLRYPNNSRQTDGLQRPTRKDSCARPAD